MQISLNSIQPTAHQSAQTRLLGLEVVRAIAITSVLFYHLNLNNFFNAGFLGVDIFFTLSGFLITSLLLREHSQFGYINIYNFYFRRFKRLYPACVGMMLGCAVFSVFLNQETAERFGKDLPAAIFYLSNWWQIYSDQSYFENFGNPPLLQHLWSLALEEQFYILWPLTLIILLKWLNKKTIGIVCIAVAIASTYWMGVVHQSHSDLNDLSRSYLGTDTHAMGLFLGAALSCFWNPWIPMSIVLTFWRKNFSFALTWLALTFLLLMTTLWHEGLTLLFHGGFFLTCLCTLVLIVSLTNLAVDSRITSKWSLKAITWVRWTSTRSYSIYLWHWPIFTLFQLSPDTTWSTIVLCMSMTALASEASYRFVERPFQQLNLYDDHRHSRLAFSGLLISTIMLLSLSMIKNWPDISNIEVSLSNSTPTENIAKISHPWLGKDPQEDDQQTKINLAFVGQSTTVTDPGITAEAPEGLNLEKKKMLVVGDSVMLGASNYLTRHFPGAIIDAVTGRQAHQGLQIIQKLLKQHPQAEIVVLHLGTNGYIEELKFFQILKTLADVKKVIVFNVYADRRWSNFNNDIIERVSSSFGNVRVVDWYSSGKQNPHFFVSDGIHLTSVGMIAIGGEISRVTGVALTIPSVLKQSKHTFIGHSEPETTDNTFPKYILLEEVIRHMPNESAFPTEGDLKDSISRVERELP